MAVFLQWTYIFYANLASKSILKFFKIAKLWCKNGIKIMHVKNEVSIYKLQPLYLHFGKYPPELEYHHLSVGIYILLFCGTDFMVLLYNDNVETLGKNLCKVHSLFS